MQIENRCPIRPAFFGRKRRADQKIWEALDRYGQYIGLAFQIKDDLLDYEGDAEVIGKSTGSDEKNHKSTYVTLLGIKKAKELLKETVEEAVKVLKDLQSADFLIKTAAYIAERKDRNLKFMLHNSGSLFQGECK